MTIERARVIAASVRRACTWTQRVLAGQRDDDDAVRSALAAIQFIEADVRCNMCGWHGEDADLVMANDSQDGELTKAACPKCLTDHYLMDFPDQPARGLRPVSQPQMP